tara:strand:+ start:5366 stop:5725 length:360 start_codon:yes stop_codon:yes gene_type:complete
MYKYIVYLLCLFFIILILNQIVNYFKPSLIEGATSGSDYQSYSQDPLILAQQNAGNIQYLKDRFSEIDALTDKIQDNSSKIDSLQTLVDNNTDSINTLVQSQQDSANQLQDTQDAVADS